MPKWMINFIYLDIWNNCFWYVPWRSCAMHSCISQKYKSLTCEHPWSCYKEQSALFREKIKKKKKTHSCSAFVSLCQRWSFHKANATHYRKNVYFIQDICDENDLFVTNNLVQNKYFSCSDFLLAKMKYLTFSTLVLSIDIRQFSMI